MLQIADLIGKPFRDGGRGPDDYDCWGLAVEVFRRAGIDLPDYQISCEASADVDQQINTQRHEWARCAGEIPVPALAVFRDRGLCTHVGVWLGGGRIIHAFERTGVAIVRADHPYWRSRIEGFYVPGWSHDRHCPDTQPHTA